MTRLRLLLLILWAVVMAVTLWALTELGLGSALRTFVSDLGHPWRAQFYADLEVHLVLLGAWILYRERRPPVGAAFALATLLLGALFTLPYILMASVRAKGDVRRLLLGARA